MLLIILFQIIIRYSNIFLDEEVPDLMPAKTKNIQEKTKKVEVKPEDKKDQKKSITKNPASPVFIA